MERYSTMRCPKFRTWFYVATTVLLLLAGLAWVIELQSSYSRRLRWTKTNLALARKSASLFAEKTGRFPKTLQELNEYGQNFSKELKWHFPPREAISSSRSVFSEHTILDGTGGLYYSPKTGQLKINLTRPLKSYWILYWGKGRNEVPADW